jgi:hypothetical protein
MVFKTRQTGLGSAGNWSTGRLEVRASADGTVFAAWAPETSPSGVRLLTLDGANATLFYESSSLGALLPSYDGAVLFTAKGLYSNEFKALSPDRFDNVETSPSLSPAYFVGLKRETATPRPARGPSPVQIPAPSLNVYSAADKTLIVTLRDLGELSAQPRTADRATAREQNNMGIVDRRIFLVPQADLLVVLAEDRDELILRRINLIAELDKSGADYLFVANAPVRTAERGRPYRYGMDVKSKRGGVTYKLESGPRGMRVETDGVLTWSVPSSSDEQASVIVSIRDDSGREILHGFTIAVR